MSTNENQLLRKQSSNQPVMRQAKAGPIVGIKGLLLNDREARFNKK